MKQEWIDTITEYMGVEPILINSSLVSAQNRRRFYWTNIEGVGQPEDENILLQEILEKGWADREKAHTICATGSCTQPGAASLARGSSGKPGFSNRHRRRTEALRARRPARPSARRRAIPGNGTC